MAFKAAEDDFDKYVYWLVAQKHFSLFLWKPFEISSDWYTGNIVQLLVCVQMFACLFGYV